MVAVHLVSDWVHGEAMNKCEAHTGFLQVPKPKKMFRQIRGMYVAYWLARLSPGQINRACPGHMPVFLGHADINGIITFV